MNKRIAYSEQVDNSTTITTATAVCMAAKDLSALTAFALTVYNAGAAALNAFALPFPEGAFLYSLARPIRCSLSMFMFFSLSIPVRAVPMRYWQNWVTFFGFLVK